MDFYHSNCVSLFLFSAHQSLPEFLLPFRKLKRIRTTFSPRQLLRLEEVFEKNQYAVGAERKELAKHLNISETQVGISNFNMDKIPIESG